MKNEFTNRQGMFHTALDTLNKAEYKVIWQGKEPEIFEEKVNSAAGTKKSPPPHLNYGCVNLNSSVL